jgi:hypothetical protein
MILMGVGGGILNSESTKVGMSLIPKERAGMASGIASTVRFSAIVIGMTALSAVAYGKVASIVATSLPELGPQDQLHLVGEIMAGHLTHAHQANAGLVQYRELALSSFASGYQALFLAASCLMLIVTVLTWFLVAAADTPPTPAPSLVRKPA